MEATQNAQAEWFYEQDGRTNGPVSEDEMIRLIRQSVVSHGTSVWRQGFPGWLKIEETGFSAYVYGASPPPLLGDSISNTVVWVLAFAPLIGFFLESVVAGAIYGGDNTQSQDAMYQGRYWFITVALNIALSLYDEKRLKEAGHNTDKFKGWVWLVPVYLYQRAKATRQNLAYFIVWMACFAIILFDL